MRFAFETAQSRPRKLLPVATKSNSMHNGMVLWDEVAAEVVKDFLGVKWDKMLVDTMTVRMVHKPQYFDTVVAAKRACIDPISLRTAKAGKEASTSVGLLILVPSNSSGPWRLARSEMHWKVTARARLECVFR